MPDQAPQNTQGEDELRKEVILKIGYVRFEQGLEAWYRIERDVIALISNQREQARQELLEPAQVDRFEVIDDTGRAYVKGSIYGSPVSVKLSYQDGGRTLKVFVSERTKKGE